MALPVLGALLRGAVASVRGTAAAASSASRGSSGKGMVSAATQSARRIPRPAETDEIAALRKRIQSPMLTVEQRQSDRRRLAQALIEGRQSRRREQAEEDDREQTRRQKAPWNVLRTELGKSSRAAGNVAMKTGLMTTGMVAATIAINKLARASNNAAIEQLRSVSPQIAAVAARRDLFELQFQARRGNLVSASTRRLSEQIMSMRQGAQPIQALAENVGNELMRGFVWLADSAFEKLEEIGFMELVRRANAWFGAEKKGPKEGHLLRELNTALRKGLHNDPNLNNRRPNERPGGRM